MRVVVVGLGVQGRKRAKVAGSDLVRTVDPAVADADCRSITEVADTDYDAALLCVPDEAKPALVGQLLAKGKHVLVEKPLGGPDLVRFEVLSRASRTVCYTAYNHRFEPHFVRMRDLIASGRLGRIYRLRLFYGNGTARLVRESAWRDKGSGVLHDLGSHLLDTVRFWFPEFSGKAGLRAADRFENRAPDFAAFTLDGSPRVECEMTLLSWRNHFTCDVFAESGTAHIESLCKWGPSTFTHRTRLLPSGRPPEETETLVQEDPTWVREYAHFKALCAAGGPSNTATDMWIDRTLGELAAQISTPPVR
ncbi:MAG: Gfo/Idh/MocA family oxidoreductase [Proteobacteria bacterium]|nr:Gfo/Idh/MocA family oxidoreductase [Pseudomonadota bacterium]